jgi:hypothetical protein
MSKNAIILIAQINVSLLVLALMTFWFVLPWFKTQKAKTAFLSLLAVHVVHHLGLTTLVDTVVAPTTPQDFAMTISIGDSAVLVAAMFSMAALHFGSRASYPLLWLFSAVGIGYNATAGVIAAPHGPSLVDKLGPHWYVGAFYVPVLLTTHVLVIVLLVRRGKELRERN